MRWTLVSFPWTSLCTQHAPLLWLVLSLFCGWLRAIVQPSVCWKQDTVPAPAKVAKHLYNLCVGQGYPAGKPQLQFLPYLLLFSLQNESFSQVKDWCEAVVKRFAVFRQRMPHVTLEHEVCASVLSF